MVASLASQWRDLVVQRPLECVLSSLPPLRPPRWLPALQFQAFALHVCEIVPCGPCLLAVLGLAACSAVLTDLALPDVAANFSGAFASGLWFENRYTDLAQLGASCQMMNKTLKAGGSIAETYQVRLRLRRSAVPRHVFSRIMHHLYF